MVPSSTVLYRLVALVLLCAAFVVPGAIPVDAHADESMPRASISALQAPLADLARACAANGPGRARDLATSLGIPIERDRLEVVIDLRHPSALSYDALAAAGCRIRGRYCSLLEIIAPLQGLGVLAELLDGSGWVRSPFRPVPCVVSEGVVLTGAQDWHARGLTGQGVEIAVIDVGFQGLAASIAAGELPGDVTTMDFTGYGMESLSRHGTVVAEIIHDMAPDAHLSLLNTYSEVQLGQAKDYCIQQGIRVINHSVGYENTGGHDGTGIVCEIADDAAINGILWCNAAGNHARKHYRGLFTDSDGDSLHEFNGGSQPEFNSLGTLTAGSPIWVYMSWYDWPTTSEDYDLELWGNDGTWRVVRASATRQTGSQPPTEEIIGYSVPFTGQYGLAARSYCTTAAHGITFLSAYQELSCQTPAGSILQPADAVGAFAVAAIRQDLWTTGPQDGYSSQGPTYDGRMKPDVSGPSGVSTWTGGSGAAGTSVASPHAAGAAALVMCAFPGWTAQEVRACLESRAIDMGPVGQDSVYGWGRLDLPLELGGAPAQARSPVLLWVAPTPFSDAVRISYHVGLPGSIRWTIFDAGGREVCHGDDAVQEHGSGNFTWQGRDDHGVPLSPGAYLVRIRAGDAVQTRRIIFLR